ncbi:DUF4136 domain-containing protein [Lacinutrix iliipiscaria]|uniref:DUF4136 domain-containing protein n=1 Tax=Lacinutrix iliipiscaria TaxID=1230532 RepID=A0ABW5WKT7_9FLAO
MKALKVCVIALLLVACAPIHVTQDYEKGTDFSKYKTYNYYQDIDTGLSAFDTKRLFSLLDEQLQLQGLVRSDTPDFYINIQSEEYQNEQRNTVGVGVGGSGRSVGGGVSVGIPIGQTQITRQIIFEFVDENEVGLFWEAVSESRYNPKASPEKREERLRVLIEKVFKKYPLKTKK